MANYSRSFETVQTDSTFDGTATGDVSSSAVNSAHVDLSAREGVHISIRDDVQGTPAAADVIEVGFYPSIDGGTDYADHPIVVFRMSGFDATDPQRKDFVVRDAIGGRVKVTRVGGTNTHRMLMETRRWYWTDA